MHQISVIVCTYNPSEEAFERCLAALDHQSLKHELWELIIVDNASTKPLTEENLRVFVQRSFELKHEPRAGLSHARVAGMRSAKCDLLVYVDDDNLLDPDYLENVLEIATRHHFLGAWSGSLIAEYEDEPSEAIQPYLELLAIRDVREESWANFINYQTAPWGAGLCLRRAVVEAYAGNLKDPLRIIFDTLSRGEDSDLAFTACDLGMGIGVFPQLKLTHLMPYSRLKEQYLLRLAEKGAQANVLVRFLHGLSPPPKQSSLGKCKQALKGMARGYSFAWRMEQARIRGQQQALALIRKQHEA